MRFVKKVQAERPAGVPPQSLEGVIDVSSIPAVMEFLTMSEWGEGEVRETSTLLVFVDEGVFKVVLNDRALSRSMWASGVSLASAMAALELRLSTETGEWRSSRGRKR